jgi:transposase InsO family protein
MSEIEEKQLGINSVALPSVNLSSVTVCSIYFETLLEPRFSLNEFSQCAACKQLVAFHHHQPSVVGIASNVNVKNESAHNSFTSGIRSNLPKWRVDYKSVKPFLDRCQQVFIADNVDPKCWVRLLLRAVEDVSESSWVKVNIVDKDLSWKQAQEAFSKHFELFSYSAQLVKEYEQIKQGPKQTVHDYSHKFNRLCAELGYEDSNTLVIQHYLNGLTPERHAAYKRQVGLVKLTRADDSFSASSLETVIQLTLDLELVDLNSQFNSSSLNENKPFSNNGKKKVCDNHPNSSSHTTAECSMNKSFNSNKNSNGSISASSSYSGKQAAPFMKKKEVKCVLCGGPHYANDPNCPKRSSFTTRSTASAAANNSSANSVKPVVASAVAQPVQNRSMDLLISEPAPASSNVGVIDRSLPEKLILPAQKNVMFLVQDKVFNTLVDTGATTSFIDESLVKELQLKIEPSSANSRIGLAQANLSTARIGRIRLDEFSAIFPLADRKLITVTHTFEVLPIKDQNKDYHFVVGSDLIPLFFPEGIPLCYVPPSSNTNGKPSILIRTTHVVEEMTADTGYTELPIPEQPNRPVASTPVELEHIYSVKRNSLLEELAEPLAINERITGFCNLPESVVKLEIDPAKENSLYTKQYPIAQGLREPADLVIKRWFDTGKICLAPPGCKYNNPLTIAPKKDENGVWTGIRVCLDVRRLNKALIVSDKFPIPNIRNVLESFGGNSIFGEFDLSEAYLQFLLHPDSQPLTAFTWYGQQYMFVGCPYGITLLTSYFQRVMMRIFSDMPFCMPYVDNIPFASKNWESHRDHAFLIIVRLTQCNLRLKQSWHIGHAELRCLGHILNAKGTAIDPDKLQVVNDWPLPSTPADLQSFLGLCSFLRSHVRHFAELTGPLEAIKNRKDLQWDDTLIHHFETVKQALAAAPVLSFPDFDRAFHIATDASNTGVGGVLFQPSSAEEHITPSNIVAICSKKLNPGQQRWSAYKKELWGIVYALRKFHTYIWGRNDLVVHTDHKPLTYMFSSSQLSPSLQQWLDTILDYSFDIRHRDGILNVIPDQLSRMFGSAYSNVPVWGAENLANHISYSLPEQDSIKIISLEAGRDEPDSASDSASITNTRPSSLEVELEKRGKQCPPTQADRIELIQKEHQFGHFGREAVFRQLFNKGYWWPSIRKEIETELKNCDPCTRFVVVKSGFHPAQFITSSGPGEHIQIDTSVHLPESPDGYTALLVCLDVFTGFVLLRPLRDTTAETVARKLWKIFCTIGFPKILQSDNGSEFVNDILRALIKITGIEHRFISPYNPRADGKVERSIGTCMMIIKKLLHGTNKHWPIFTSFAQITFNNKITSLTGSSPFALMFGRELNELKDYSDEKNATISLDDWKSHQEKIASLIYPAISDRIKSGKDKLIQTLDKNRRLLSPSSFPTGATVMIIDPVRKDKFEPKYIGPYTIVRRARGGAYVLKDATGDLLDRHVPADKMKLIAKSKRRVDVDTPIYQINKIISHRGNPGHYEYLVDWKGYSQDEQTWEPESSFLDHSVIQTYWRENPQISAQ